MNTKLNTLTHKLSTSSVCYLSPTPFLKTDDTTYLFYLDDLLHPVTLKTVKNEIQNIIHKCMTTERFYIVDPLIPLAALILNPIYYCIHK